MMDEWQTLTYTLMNMRVEDASFLDIRHADCLTDPGVSNFPASILRIHEVQDLLSPENGGNQLLRNTDIYLTVYTASYFKVESSAAALWGF
jgi:hypothetical protein